MLILGSRLLTQPVMSLQTGGELGQLEYPIIDPADLAILGYSVNSPLLPKPSYLRLEDVRELSDIGFIIDSVDEFVTNGDVIKLDEIVDLGFELMNKRVNDEKGRKLGKIIDYTVEVGSFTIQQLTVKRPMLRSLSDTELLVHRSQIIEINNYAIVIHSEAKIPEHTRVTSPGSYVNPFRKPAAAPESVANFSRDS